jgi:5S rRNA maturation endonuclease (ribonuclease M5)
MIIGGIQPKITKAFVESKVSEIEIFSKYLEIDIGTIQWCLDRNKLICNPLRIDEHPTAGFYSTGNKIRFNDFAGYFHGDCYDVVAYKNFLDARSPDGFARILQIIAADFGLIDSDVLLQELVPMHMIKKPKEYVDIQVQERNWMEADSYYWGRFNISQEITRLFEVVPVYAYFINEELRYMHADNDPAYAYYGGFENRYLWQIYHPYRKEHKFVTNYMGLRATAQLQKSKVGVITKSVKDAMCLYSFGVNSCSLAAESMMPSATEIHSLVTNWENPYCLTDFDFAGIKIAQKLKRKGIWPVFLTTGKRNTLNYKAKDIAEFTYKYGPDKTGELIEILMEDQYQSPDYFDLLNKLL